MHVSPSLPCHVIGIDAGGTKIAAGVLTIPDGQVIARRTIPAGASRGGRAVLDDVVALGRELAGDAAGRGGTARAIGFGICELVDLNGNLASANCLRLSNEAVRAELATIAPAVIEADELAAALAEYLLGD